MMGNIFVYTSCSASGVGGVGLLIAKKHFHSFCSADSICERLLALHFEGNPRATNYCSLCTNRRLKIFLLWKPAIFSPWLTCTCMHTSPRRLQFLYCDGQSLHRFSGNWKKSVPHCPTMMAKGWLNSCKPPYEWMRNLILPTPKKGDIINMDNYHGISMMSVAARLYKKMLFSQICELLDNILGVNQAGVWQSRGCSEQIRILRRIVEDAADNLPLISTFVDFKKAFDSVDRNIMLKILRAYGVPKIIILCIIFYIHFEVTLGSSRR